MMNNDEDDDEEFEAPDDGLTHELRSDIAQEDEED